MSTVSMHLPDSEAPIQRKSDPVIFGVAFLIMGSVFPVGAQIAPAPLTRSMGRKRIPGKKILGA